MKLNEANYLPPTHPAKKSRAILVYCLSLPVSSTRKVIVNSARCYFRKIFPLRLLRKHGRKYKSQIGSFSLLDKWNPCKIDHSFVVLVPATWISTKILPQLINKYTIFFEQISSHEIKFV